MQTLESRLPMYCVRDWGQVSSSQILLFLLSSFKPTDQQGENCLLQFSPWRAGDVA